MPLSSTDLGDLRQAKALLENPGLVAKISDMLGNPLEKGFGMLPKKWGEVINEAASRAIAKAMDVALSTMNTLPSSPSSNGWHKWAVGASGAVGGAFGLSALLIELPVSTTIMLRSIADVARSEGEDLNSPESQLECVQVLALGGRSAQDDAAEAGYFTTRAAMAQAVSEAARQVGKKGLAQRKGPALVRLIAQVASRFSVNVSEKVMAQAVPVVGAVGGAVINTLFMEHFQRMARGHFIVRRLEREHGVEAVRVAYAGITGDPMADHP